MKTLTAVSKETVQEPIWVMGADLDVNDARHLVHRDIVLAEMNGARTISAQSCPLVAEMPWEVKENDKFKLILTHPKTTHELVLPYSSLIRGSNNGPAVFMIRDSYFSKNGPIFVILQFASHAIPLHQASDYFPEKFDASLLTHPDTYETAIRAAVDVISKFDHPGWGYRSICRFALRSHVHAKTINAFREKKWDIIKSQPKETLIQIFKELAWMPFLLAQSVAYDFTTESKTIPE